MTAVSVVQPQYGPTLLQLLAPRPLRVRVAAGVFALLLVLAAIVIGIRSVPDEQVVLLHKPITFNFAYGPKLHRVQEAGTLVALRRPKRGPFLESYVIRDLHLPPYQGAVGGMLPLYAYGYMQKLQKRYQHYEFVTEGRTRINNGVGYNISFRARRNGHTLYVRHLLLVPELPDGQRHGVVLELETTFAAGTPNIDAVGNVGALKQALRSFRFGEDRKGGTS
ncbi:MAG: hypothetical protein QOG15_502 [Solirubrobacteraceae bacterium]|jgi:hypothetical protein|nr:hypothetical protein [Solirubrobacteraceae bacterium]